MKTGSVFCKVFLITIMFFVPTLVQGDESGLDNSFGANGITTGNFGNMEKLRVIVIQPDEKIVVGGSTAIPRGRSGDEEMGDLYDTYFAVDPILMRFNSDGTPDRTFGPDRKDDLLRHAFFGGEGNTPVSGPEDTRRGPAENGAGGAANAGDKVNALRAAIGCSLIR